MSNFVTFLYIVNFIIAFTVIFLERKNPSKTLAWIMVLFLLPGFGIFLYLMLSQNISRQKLFRLTTFEEANISNSLFHQMSDIKNKIFPFARPKRCSIGSKRAAIGRSAWGKFRIFLRRGG